MPIVTLRGVTDTYATQASPKQASGDAARLYLRTQSNKSMATYMLVTTNIPAGATVVSAHLYLVCQQPWSGSTTVTTQRVTESWSPSKLTWNNQPAATSSGEVSQSVSGLAIRDVLDIDVTPLVQSFASGTPNYGFKITSTGTGLQTFYSADSKASGSPKPYMVVEYVTEPAAPTGLRPSGSQAVSTARPTFTWTYSDAMSAQMSAYQLQLSETGDFDAPDYDSGEIAASVAEHPMDEDVPVAFFWRVRVKNAASSSWSPWSAPAEGQYVDHSALVIDSPADNGTTTDSSPVVDWSFSGTQTAWQVILRRGTTIIHDTGYQAGADGSWGLNRPLSYAAGPISAEVRVWDDVDRATTPGDPAYASASSTFTYEPSDQVPGAYDLFAHVDDIKPTVRLSWKRTNIPDVWTIYRDGEPIARHDGSELYVDGVTFEYEDMTASPLVAHQWTVVAGENDEDSEERPIASATVNRYYAWLLDEEEPNWWIAIADREALDLSLGQVSEIIHTRGSDRAVLIHDSLRGYEGTIAGGLYDGLPGLGGEGVRWLRDRVWHLKENPTRVYRLVVADMNIPVVVRNVNVINQPTGDAAYSISFEAYQQGELAW